MIKTETTYSSTPAGMYLARLMIELYNPTFARCVGKRITATNRSVAELLSGYETGSVSAKTVANCLRLMRLEISNEVDPFNGVESTERLIDQLRRNVQIGAIKRAIRLTTIARKAEHVMAKPGERARRTEVVDNLHLYKVVDTITNAEYTAGYSSLTDGDTWSSIIYREEFVDIDPNLLHDRSLRRCTRLGKPHTK